MRDLEDLTNRLRRRLIDGSRITHVTALSGGHSSETYLLHGVGKVLRMGPSAVTLMERALDVRQQFDLFAILRGRPGAPPLPRLDYVCDDPEVLGAPFFVMDYVEGIAGLDWDPGEWLRSGTIELRDAVSRQYLVSLADLQSVGPLNILGPVKDNRQELDRWRWTVRDVHLPELTGFIDGLQASAPPMLPPTIVHGDYKIANMLWNNGKLVATLDWEMAFNGDPRWDIAQILCYIDGPAGRGAWSEVPPGVWDRDRNIGEWQERTGLSAADIMWFEAGQCAKGAAVLFYGHHLWRTGQSTDQRFEQWADVALHALRRGEILLEKFIGRPTV